MLMARNYSNVDLANKMECINNRGYLLSLPKLLYIFCWRKISSIKDRDGILEMGQSSQKSISGYFVSSACSFVTDKTLQRETSHIKGLTFEMHSLFLMQSANKKILQKHSQLQLAFSKNSSTGIRGCACTSLSYWLPQAKPVNLVVNPWTIALGHTAVRGFARYRSAPALHLDLSGIASLKPHTENSWTDTY